MASLSRRSPERRGEGVDVKGMVERERDERALSRGKMWSWQKEQKENVWEKR